MSSLAWGNVLPWESLKYVADGYLLPKSLMYWGTCLATWCRIGSFGSSKGIDSPMAAMVLSFPYFLNARSQAVWPSSSIWKRSPRSFGWYLSAVLRKMEKHLIGRLCMIAWMRGSPLYWCVFVTGTFLGSFTWHLLEFYWSHSWHHEVPKVWKWRTLLL